MEERQLSPFDSVPRSRRAAALAPPHESSQMFTLAALVGRASSTPPPPPEASVHPTGRAKKDGSGVIDLNALARAAEERMRKANSEPPPSAFAREARSVADEPPPTIGRKLRYFGIGAAALVLAAAGIVVAISGGDEPKAQVHATATPSQQVEQPTTATPEPQLAPVPVDTKDDDKASAPAPKAGKGRKGGHGRAIASGPKLTKVASPGTNVSSKPPPPPKPPAGSDPCGCKGNLQCAIKCFK